jgi:DNA mismatch repair ATPase MutS
MIIDTRNNGVRFRNNGLRDLNDEYVDIKEKYTEQQKSVVDEIVNIAGKEMLIKCRKKLEFFEILSCSS